MTPLVVAVIGLLSSLLGGGMATAINALAKRRTEKVDAAGKLNDSTLKWAEELQEDAAEARKDAREARREAAACRVEAEKAHQQMQQVHAEASELAAELRALRVAIMHPAADIETLRAMVSGPVQGR